MTQRCASMSEQILSQDEVDALLQGITGESQKPSRKRRPPARRPQLRHREPGAHRPRAHADDGDHQRALRAQHPLGLFNFIRKSPEISIGGVKVQKYSAFLREIVVPTNFNIVSVRPLRGSRPDRLRPDAGVRGHRRAVRRQRQVPHAHRGPRLLAHRAAHHPAPASRSSRPNTSKAWAGIYPLRAGLPALGDAAAVRQHRDAERDRGRDHRSRSRSATPAARSTSASRTRRSSRSATCCTRRSRATRTSPTGAGSTLLKQQIQAAEVELVAELAHAPAHRRAAARVQAGRLHRARPAAGDPGQGGRRAGASTATTAPRTASTRSRSINC